MRMGTANRFHDIRPIEWPIQFGPESDDHVGRRVLQLSAVKKRRDSTSGDRKRAQRSRRVALPVFTKDHPIFRLLGIGRSGGRYPGARDKHRILSD